MKERTPPLPGAPAAMMGGGHAAQWLAGTARGLKGVLDGFAGVAGAARRAAQLPGFDWAEPALAPDGLHLPALPERQEPSEAEAAPGRSGAQASAGSVDGLPGAAGAPPVAPPLLRDRLRGGAAFGQAPAGTDRPALDGTPATTTRPMVSAERLAAAARELKLADFPGGAPARAETRPAEAAALRGAAPARPDMTAPARGMALVADLVDRWERAAGGGSAGAGTNIGDARNHVAGAYPVTPRARAQSETPPFIRTHAPEGDTTDPARSRSVFGTDTPPQADRPESVIPDLPQRKSPAAVAPGAPQTGGSHAGVPGADITRPSLPEYREDGEVRAIPPEPQQQVHLSVQVALPPQAGTPGADTDDLSRRIKQILVAEARRHGIDLT